ncbi:hypothetical protein ACF3NT_06655 [Naumannella halotolerans]|uniref:hypothetical protein n=1 Tax=Naumannella halotolerans TaxID=993414 RepID=UPI00370DE1A7
MNPQAPVPPGALGRPAEPAQLQQYLSAMISWCTDRKTELDALDEAVLAEDAETRTALTKDMMLSLALWQAVADRLDLLEATWDSGRVGRVELERLSSLIWGRLDATLDPALIAGAGRDDDRGTGNGLAVSLPEACRLSDALAAQLRARLADDPQVDRLRHRLRDLRAQLERIRDQIAWEPAELQAAPTRELAALQLRTDDLFSRSERGADIGGMIGPVEIEAARMERDLIVGGAERRAGRALVEQAEELRADLLDRSAALAQLIEQTVRRVQPAPKYALPDVTALGPPPAGKPEVTAYLSRLEQASAAMQVVQHAYSQALGEHTKLRSDLASVQRRAASIGVAEDPTLLTLTDLAEELLTCSPCPLPLTGRVIEAGREALVWRSNQNPVSSDSGAVS